MHTTEHAGHRKRPRPGLGAAPSLLALALIAFLVPGAPQGAMPRELAKVGAKRPLTP